MTKLRWALGAAAGLLSLAAAAIVVLTMLIDPDRFKSRIETMAEEATGMPLRIDGDLDITWFPWLAVRMGAARLGDAPSLALWDEARVGARLIPLLRGDLVIDRVRLRGLQLQLIRAKDGRANWQPVLDSRESAERKEGSLAIAGLEIRDGALVHRDEAGGEQQALDAWELDVSQWESGKPFSLRTRFQLRPSPESRAIPVELNLSDVEITAGTASVSMPRIDADVASAHIIGEAHVRGTEPMKADGRVSLEAKSLRELLSDLGIGGPRPLDREALGALSVDARWTVSGAAVTVEPLAVAVDDTRIEGRAARSPGQDAPWIFELAGDAIALDRYMNLEVTDDEPFALPTEALRKLRVQGVLSFASATLARANMIDVRIRLELEDGKIGGAMPGAPP